MRKTIFVILACLLLLPPVFGEDNSVETLVVNIPEFDVTLNGNVYNNTTEPYPIIIASGVTYLPMTWDICSALGLNRTWDNTNQTLDISKRGDMTVYQQRDYVYNNSRLDYTATIVRNKVSINGQLIDQTNTNYPLIRFRDITYFPLSWSYTRDEFDVAYSWSREYGVKIDCDPKLKVHIPETQKFTYRNTMDKLSEIRGDSEAFFTVAIEEMDGQDYLNITIFNNYDPLWHDYILIARLDTFDASGNYLNTRTFTGPMLYQYDAQRTINSILTCDASVPFDAFELNLELVPPNIARAQLKASNEAIEFEVIQGQPDFEAIKSSGAVYIDGRLFHYTLDNAPEDLMHYGLIFNTGYCEIDGVPVVHTFSQGIYSPGKLTEYEYQPLYKIDALGIDPTADYHMRLKGTRNNFPVFTDFADALYLYDSQYKLIKIIVTDTRY